jgi:hypothetical protein
MTGMPANDAALFPSRRRSASFLFILSLSSFSPKRIWEALEKEERERGKRKRKNKEERGGKGATPGLPGFDVVYENRVLTIWKPS